MKKYAFIFARGGSKGLKNKNILNFNGLSLLAHTIQFAKKSLLFDKIFVSTEDKKILSIAKKYGAEIIQRPKYLSKDNSPEILSWKHAINFLKKNNDVFDLFISLPTTSPLRSILDVKKCIKKYNKKIDAVITFAKTSRNPCFNMIKINDNDFVELVNKTNKLYSRRQDAPNIYDMTTVCYVTNPKYVLKVNNIFEGKIKGVEIPNFRSLDIDSKLDFTITKYIYKFSKKFYESNN